MKHCSGTEFFPANFVVRDVRRANALLQSDVASMREFLKLTTNSYASRVQLSLDANFTFFATDPFFDAWKAALGMTANSAIRKYVYPHRQMLDSPFVKN